ncbi:hypothetical protein JX266_014394, partial [Neoarthrinium moseri]
MIIESPDNRSIGEYSEGSVLSQLHRNDEIILAIFPQLSTTGRPVSLHGLGGSGKTQIALEAAFRIRQTHPKCSVIRVPAVTAAMFDNAYRAIGQRLGTAGLNDDKADLKPLVKAALERTLDDWLLIVDNADNTDLIFGDD